MKVLKVAEVVQGMDRIIKKKEQEKEHILLLRDELNKVIDLDNALDGEGGVAIREHFMTLHFPVIILLNLFLEEYIDLLKKFKQEIEAFENDNGFIREDFLNGEIKNSLNNLENNIFDITAAINKSYGSVSDLVGYDYISTSTFNFHVTDAHQLMENVLSDLTEIDSTNSSSLSNPEEKLSELGQLTGKIKTWTSNGIFLTEEQIQEVEAYFLESDVIEDMIDEAMKLSTEQGDSTIVGAIATWISNLGKVDGAYKIAKGALAASILSTKMLELVPDGKGNFTVVASQAWKQGTNGKYSSTLAGTIYDLLKKGSQNAPNPIKHYLSKYGNAPSGLLKELIGLNSRTTKISFGTIANKYTNVLVLEKDALKDYRMNVDLKATGDKVADVKKFGDFARRVPYAGIIFSVGVNSSEYYSDANAHLSFEEKTGRFVAGLAIDGGIAGLTTGFAALGTLVAPGPGTIIGGVIGAGIGIVGSWIMEDTIKDIGEDVGRWVGNTIDDVSDWAEDVGNTVNDIVSGVGETVDDITSGIGDFVSGIFN